MGNKSHFFRQSSGGVIGSPFLNFRFEESITDDNTVIDNIGGLNATLTGNKTTVREKTGKIDKGYFIVGFVELQSFSLNETFSYKFWHKTNYSSLGELLGVGGTGNYDGVMIYSNNGNIEIRYGNNQNRGGSGRKSFNTNGLNLNDNQWNQIVVNVRGFADFDLFINGVIYSGGFAESGGATFFNKENLKYYIGAIGQLQNIDEFTIFNQELTPEEISEIYNKESNGIRVF